ncbi:hypothetical protein PTKU46_82910 [Paraburkholderia terrae]|uniref:hypothetical protein n=1 Tax=Paraburkholderia terrae TaxID=311230 RepID=UPI0030E2C668
MAVTIRLDNFDGVNDHLYVVLSIEEGHISGDWRKTAATLEDFPDEGTWSWDLAGASLSDKEGKQICQLSGFAPAQPEPPEGLVGKFGDHYLPYTGARWHRQD